MRAPGASASAASQAAIRALRAAPLLPLRRGGECVSATQRAVFFPLPVGASPTAHAAAVPTAGPSAARGGQNMGPDRGRVLRRVEYLLDTVQPALLQSPDVSAAATSSALQPAMGGGELVRRALQLLGVREASMRNVVLHHIVPLLSGGSSSDLGGRGQPAGQLGAAATPEKAAATRGMPNATQGSELERSARNALVGYTACCC